MRATATMQKRSRNEQRNSLLRFFLNINRDKIGTKQIRNWTKFGERATFAKQKKCLKMTTHAD